MDGAGGWTKRRTAPWGGAALVLLAGLLAVPGVRAQQPTDSSSQQDMSDQQPSASPPGQPVVTNLETGQTLNSLLTPWRWGRLSLLSMSLQTGYNTNNRGFSNTFDSASGLLVYSIQKEKTGLILQYQPSVFVTARVTNANLLGNYLSFNTYRDWTSRLRLDISDGFHYVPNQLRFLTPGFTQDFTTGTVTQQPVLITGQNYLTDSLAATLSYQMNATDSISFNSTYNINNVSVNQSTPTQSTNLGQTFGEGVTWAHQWTETRRIGLTYQYARTFLGSASNGSLFYTVMASYEQDLFPSVTMDLSFGPSYGISQEPSGTGSVALNTEKTYQGSFGLQKRFERSALSFHFSRSQNFSGIVSDRLSNRYDVAYIRPLGTRWSVSTGGSYLEQGGMSGGNLRGRSGWVQCGYRLSRNWSAVVNYSYFAVQGIQQSSVLGIQQPYDSQFLSAGLRWAWGSESNVDQSAGVP
jgi:hypothetical protein